MSQKNSQKTRKTAVPPIDNYIRETCLELDAKYDREALRLLCGFGVFDVDSGGTNLGEAVDRLRDVPDAESDQICAAQEAAAKSTTYEKRQVEVGKLEKLETERLTESVETAYLLGIAVGRRLGPAALHVAGGTR